MEGLASLKLINKIIGDKYVRIGDSYAEIDKSAIGKMKEEDIAVFVKAGCQLGEEIIPYKMVSENLKVHIVGKVFPLDILPKDYEFDGYPDITALLRVQRNYENPIDKLRNKIYYKKKGIFKKYMVPILEGYQKSLYKGFTYDNYDIPLFSIEDLDLINYNTLITNEEFKGLSWELTEKVKGTSVYYLYNYRENTYQIYNKNFEIIDSLENYSDEVVSPYLKINEKLNIKDKLKQISKDTKSNIVLLNGTICGKGVYNNYYDFNDYKLFVHELLLDGEPQTYRSMELLFINSKLDLELVPKIDTIKLPEDKKELNKYLKEKSRVNPEKEICGFVAKIYESSYGFQKEKPKFRPYIQPITITEKEENQEISEYWKGLEI